ELRRSAALVLADIRDPADNAVLLEALAREPAPRVRAAILKGLGRLADVSALPVIERALDDPSEELAGEAVLAIGFICERAKDATAARNTAVELISRRFEKLGAA